MGFRTVGGVIGIGQVSPESLSGRDSFGHNAIIKKQIDVKVTHLLMDTRTSLEKSELEILFPGFRYLLLHLHAVGCAIQSCPRNALCKYRFSRFGIIHRLVCFYKVIAPE